MATKVALKAIDADAHVIESERTWEYMTDEESKYRPQLFSSPDDTTRRYWVIDGRIRGLRLPTLSEKQLKSLSERSGRDLMTTAATRQMEDVSLRLEHMDALGVDMQVLHNTLWIRAVTQRPEVDVALTSAWNRWMADVWKDGGGRLTWASVLPLTDIPKAIELMEFAKDNGAVGAVMKPWDGDRFMLDPYYHPLFEAAQRLDLTVTIHIANASDSLMQVLDNAYDPSGGLPQFRMPTVHACNALLLSDLPKRFPDLRWGFVESSAQWVPWILHEVRRRAKQNGQALPDNPFEEYKIWVTAQTDDDFEYVFNYIGENQVTIGTDYGHTDTSSEVDAIETFRNMPNLTDSQKHKVLVKNAQAMYGLK